MNNKENENVKNCYDSMMIGQLKNVQRFYKLAESELSCKNLYDLEMALCFFMDDCDLDSSESENFSNNESDFEDEDDFFDLDDFLDESDEEDVDDEIDDPNDRDYLELPGSESNNATIDIDTTYTDEYSDTDMISETNIQNLDDCFDEDESDGFHDSPNTNTPNYEELLEKIIEDKVSENVVSALLIRNNVQSIQNCIDDAIKKQKRDDENWDNLYPLLSFFNLLNGDCYDEFYDDEESEEFEEVLNQISLSDGHKYMDYLASIKYNYANYFDLISNINFQWLEDFLNRILASEYLGRLEFTGDWNKVEREMKDVLINDTFNELPKLIKTTQNWYFEIKTCNYYFLNKNLTLYILESIELILQKILDWRKEQKFKYIYEIQEAEYNRIMSNMAHSIKNLLCAVIDPLHNLKKEFPDKSRIIDNAIRGAHLIGEIANVANISTNVTIDDLIYDIEHIDNYALSIEEMILNSLKYSISNMFDGIYFQQFMSNYYPYKTSKSESQYQKAHNDWQSVSTTTDFNELIDFAKQYLFDLELHIDDTQKYLVGDTKNSAIKLMILIQEMIINAVKYCSFVPRDKRFVKVTFVEKAGKISFLVANSYKSTVMARTTGFGNKMIKDFAKVLECEPSIIKNDDIYSVELLFNNYWRVDGKNPVH